MQIDWSLGVIGNIKKLYDERNAVNGRVDNTNNAMTEGQAETDELMLDHEERLILLEVGE